MNGLPDFCIENIMIMIFNSEWFTKEENILAVTVVCKKFHRIFLNVKPKYVHTDRILKQMCSKKILSRKKYLPRGIILRCVPCHDKNFPHGHYEMVKKNYQTNIKFFVGLLLSFEIFKGQELIFSYKRRESEAIFSFFSNGKLRKKVTATSKDSTKGFKEKEYFSNGKLKKEIYDHQEFRKTIYRKDGTFYSTIYR